MKVQLILPALVLGVVAFGLWTTSAHACTEGPEDEYLCVRWTAPKPVQVAVNKGASEQVAANAIKRTGKSPEDALEAEDQWLAIPARTLLWYRLPYSSNPLKIEMWVDAYRRPGITLEVFSPDKEKNLWNEKPTGRGSYNKAEAAHDLWWTGETLVVGTWYARVTNTTEFPIDHKLGYKRKGFSRACVQYIETLYEGGSPILWTLCDKTGE